MESCPETEQRSTSNPDKGKQAVRAVRVSKVVSALMLNANTNVSVPVNLSNQVLSLLGFVGKHPLNVLVNSGCSTNFVSTMLVSKLRLPTQQSVEAFQVERADGSYLQCNKKVQQLEYQIQDYQDQLGFSVMPLSHYDMILGQSWLYQYDPIISFRDHSIRLFHRNQEVELRGLFNTQPITMVSAMQVKRLVRKRDCTTALVMLREAKDDTKSDPNFSAAPMASGGGQSNPSTSRDAGGEQNEDYGNEYGPPLPTLEELREMEHRRLVGEATNTMLNVAKDPNLVKYMTETTFQDVLAQWKATTTSPPKKKVVFREGIGRGGVKRFVYISAFDFGFPSFILRGYYEGKKAAEDAIQIKFPYGGVILRPGFIYGDRQVGNMKIPLGVLGSPLETALKYAKSATQIPVIGPLFVPPVKVASVAKAAVRAATDNAVPPGVLDVWGINRLGDR
ncbi:hypothetical protein L7F22_069341 [Adiantum nelumboides]|nr:hypothetical protein [Adiantum nelumboides]